MGYAGYSPGDSSRMPDALTPLQEALQQLPLEQAAETLAVIDKLTRNIVRNPGEAKFRKINLANEKIKQVIAEVPNAIALLQEMGWIHNGDSLELPPNVRLEHGVHVIGIIEAQEHFKTQLAKERTRRMRASKEVDADTAKLREQMEIDRKEKAADGPVTKGSVAKKLPNGAQMQASDLGIGASQGG